MYKKTKYISSVLIFILLVSFLFVINVHATEFIYNENETHIISEELKELLAICNVLLEEKGLKDNSLLHSFMNDHESGTETDFLNSTYAYLISIKENIGKYFN